MTDTNAEAGLEFPINQQLLEDATRAREEWRVVRDRLSKIEQNKEQVSPVVYDRVRRDYDSRLKEATAELLQKKKSVDQELASLRETRKKIHSQLDEHRHRLEEIKFRNTLGEFSEEEYQSSARTEQDKIAKFETVIGAVDTNINRYEAIFEGEVELFATPETEPAGDDSAVHEVSNISGIPHDAEPITDAKGFVIDEGTGPDYFGGATDADRTSPEIEESQTERGAPPPEGKRLARVVIISGDDAGASYPVKGTVSFGRAESNTIVLKDSKASRQHAQIQQQGSEYVVVDLNSSNGTYVNGQRIEEHVLSNGDEIMVGDAVMQFQA
ncbi:MAG TPA: FHA domain-containing protein [bacterium]|nr:FHA domain-containing protein [bacterium]